MDYAALVKLIASSLVTKPDAVAVTSSQENGALCILIHVAEEDTGRVIGRRGATINAIRQIVRVASVKSGENVEVDVAETEDRNAPEASD
ncbi:MAG: KH domain-containing protein [Pyramidobacter sp.]|nr:KH domain-containing protein [Pyramidobacter sp.]